LEYQLINEGVNTVGVPGTVVRACLRRIAVRVRVDGREKLVSMDPDKVIREERLYDFVEADSGV
jgi:hypothetical protein